MAAERTVVVRIKAEYRAFEASMKAAARAAEQASEKIDKSGKKSSSALGQLLLDAKQHEQSWEIAGGAMLGFGAAVVGMVGVSVAKYAAFDKAMSRVKAATHASTTEMNSLREAAISAGADTAFSAEEAAQGIEELAKAGVSTSDILSGGLNGALSLAAAGELAVADAAEIAASALTQFKLSGDQIPHLADLLAAGAGKAQGSVSDMGAALDQSGLVAASTGATIEETTGVLAAFASAGLTGSDAGTSFKTMLQRLTPQSDVAAKKMEELGISAYDANGNFIGMSEYAGVLQDAMKDLTPEARNAAMGIMFGSDAVRASTILYEQGAAGIEKWEDAVNAAGYAAQTAMIMQDNLAGDVEKLGGAFDTVFIKAGGGANDALRGLVQTGEDFVDAIGKIPGPALATVGSIAGIVGVTALAAGAFMTLAPKAIETWGAFRSLGTEGSKIPGTFGKITKAAGIAAVALAGLQIIGELITREHTKSATDYAEAVMKISQAGEKASNSDLDSLFDSFDTVAGGKRAGEIHDLAGAVGELANPSKLDSLNRGLNFMNGWFNLPSDKLTLVEGRLGDLGATLGDLAKAGDIESTAKTFSLISDEFERNGKSAKDALDTMPEYKAALQEIAMQSGVTASDGELLIWAMDGIAPAGVAAAQGAEAAAEGLATMGISAEGAVTELDKLVEAMFAMSDGTLNVRSATRGFQEAIDGIDASIKENGKSLDETTAKGRANAAALDAVAQGGKDIATAMSTAKDANGNFVHTQDEVQASLKGTYDATYAAARAFGLGKTESAALARELLGIPKDVSVDTWIADTAKNGADATRDAVNGIPDMKGVTVIVTDKGSVSVTAAQIQSIKDRTVSTQVTDDGTILTVQGGINNIDGTTEQIIVSDDGTVQVVQQRINETTGKTEYITVSDGGTVSGVQAAINSVTGKTVRILTINSVRNEPAGGPGGSGGITRATGGSVFGAGTETSDSIPAWLSNNEHVLSAKEVRGLGGHGAVERLRMMARMGDAPAFKNGGRVGWSQGQDKQLQTGAARATAARKQAERELKEAEKAATSASRRSADTPGDKDNKDAKAAAKKAARRAADAKKRATKELAAAKKAEDAAKKKLQDSKARTARLSEGTFDLRRDTKRGEFTDAFTSGSGMSIVDRAFEASNNMDLSKSQRNALRAWAYKTEDALLKLEKRAEATGKKLEGARQKRDELLSIRDGVASGLRGETTLGGLISEHQATRYGKVTASGIAALGKSKVAKLKAFGNKLDALRKKGYGGAVIQEIAEMGTEAGTEAANILLSSSTADRNAINQVYKDLETQANRAGNFVTDALSKGGLNAAQSLVDQLAKEEGNIEKAFYNLGIAGQKGFHKAWGIASPSKEAKKDAKHIVDGSVLGLKAEAPRFAAAMEGMYAMPDAARYAVPAYVPAQQMVQPAAAAVTQVRVFIGNEEFTSRMTTVAEGVVDVQLGQTARLNSHLRH